MNSDKPPKHLVMKMTEQNLQDNLVSIVKSMERIRQEGITNLEASSEQKMDYLRLTEELASCLKDIIKEKELEDHVKAVVGLADDDLLLRNYDPLQPEFWNDRQPKLKIALDDASVVLLRDDFVSEAQHYHVFQALKYLNIKGSERDDVYETILPVNSLLNENSLSSPEISQYLMKKLLGNVVNNGVGVDANLDVENFVKSLEQIGALYVNLSKEDYSQMKKIFPKTIIVEENGQTHARVIFGSKETRQGYNVFKQLQEFAQLDLGDTEKNLVRKMRNFYGFGEKFLKSMKEKIGVEENRKKPTAIRSERKPIIILDESPEDNGNKRNQNQWFDYWDKIKDSRVMASMGDLYESFKYIRRVCEQGTDDEKSRAQTLLNSLRQDFEWPRHNNWLIGSTRINYSQNSLDAKIIQHYRCNQPDLIKETDIIIPVYRGVPITQIANENEGLAYLQALFDTEDEGETIIQTLEFISRKNRNEIKGWTAATSGGTYTRTSHPERAAGFYVNDVGFHVSSLDSIIGFQGRSRGVQINPRSGRAGK